jgi:hypothetical protein
MARIRLAGGIRGEGGLNLDNITKGLENQLTQYSNKVQKGESGTVLQDLKTSIQEKLDVVKATGFGGAVMSKIESLQTKLNEVTGANSTNNNATPNTSLPTAKNVNLNITVPNIGDQISREIVRNQDVWSDVFSRAEKDYLSL